MEGTPTPIVSGRASKIPPIYERPITSNISVEEGGVINVSKSCSRQPLTLSVTRGVRSRPLDDVNPGVVVETVPLLSPTMESELLKQPWTFPRTKVNLTKDEDNTNSAQTFSSWEEDFQDLSSWCMDTFQGQCDFHIGESATFKISGTKYEGNGVSVDEEKLLKDLKSMTNEEKRNLKMDTVKAIEELSDNNRHLLLSPSNMVNEYTIGYSNEENNATNSWIMSPESTASTTASTSSTSKKQNADVGAPLEIAKDIDYTSTFDSTANKRETDETNWDELRTIETTGSETFDLLSYLWDEGYYLQGDVRSSEGSVSTESSVKFKSLSPASSSVFSHTPTKVKTEEVNNEPTPPKRRRMETRATTATVTSSSVEATPATSSRRSERKRTTSSSGKEKEKISVLRIKTRDKNGRKKYYESESEDDVALSQYRECREKNNEASRRSRMNKKAKESEMAMRAVELERDNKILKMKVEELEKLVTSMRSALLQSALKKEF